MPASLCLTFAMLLWGSSYIALKYALLFYPPQWVMFGRMVITLVACLLLWRWVKQYRYQTGDWKILSVMSLAEPCLYFLFEGHALQYTSAAQAGVLVSCLPIFVAILAWFTLKERVSRFILFGFLLCISGGIGLSLVSPGSDYAPRPLLGNSLEMLAMLCAAVYTICVKKLAGRYSPLSLIAIQGFTGTLFFAPQAAMSELPQQHDTASLLAVLYLGSVVTLGAYGLYNYAIVKISVLKAAAFSNLTPVFSLFLAILILGEQLNLWQGIAIATVFLGVYISQQHRQATPCDKVENASA
ncbi:DMT family transporter [Motilimonas pumila]|uniref:DMT family transporter n=1 Tax=Motilimonas pumila TaxID=2303987 RepID=A0A418Y9Z5_9GAMM|nr:DMT family transporter [Motilimonas pumila]RJG38626.1 DMT family transporter [Motilimonas pumila]